MSDAPSLRDVATIMRSAGSLWKSPGSAALDGRFVVHGNEAQGPDARYERKPLADLARKGGAFAINPQGELPGGEGRHQDCAAAVFMGNRLRGTWDKARLCWRPAKHGRAYPKESHEAFRPGL